MQRVQKMLMLNQDLTATSYAPCSCLIAFGSFGGPIHSGSSQMAVGRLRRWLRFSESCGRPLTPHPPRGSRAGWMVGPRPRPAGDDHRILTVSDAAVVIQRFKLKGLPPMVHPLLRCNLIFYLFLFSFFFFFFFLRNRNLSNQSCTCTSFSSTPQVRGRISQF